MNTYGNGQPAPPAMPREAIELHRFAGRIAEVVHRKVGDDHWMSIEADNPRLLSVCRRRREHRVCPGRYTDVRFPEIAMLRDDLFPPMN